MLIILLNVNIVFADYYETDTIHSSIDTFVSLNDPLSNHGGKTEMPVSKSSVYGIYEAYLQFDLTKLPKDIAIDSAVLKLRSSEGKGGTQTVSVYSCGNQQWDEFKSTWMDFQDMPLELLDSVTIPHLAEFEWDITEAVKSSLSYEYFTLKVASESPSGYVKFYSKEGHTVSLTSLLIEEWPRISVSYTLPDTTPPKISDVSFDPLEPVAVSDLFGFPIGGDIITCRATITDDDSGIASAVLVYRTDNDALYQRISMKLDSDGSMYYATIPEQEESTSLSITISATNTSGNAQFSESYDLYILYQKTHDLSRLFDT